MSVDPTSIGISQSKRAVPIPADLPKAKKIGDTITTTVDADAIAKATAEAGITALEGKGGPVYDSLVYASAICLLHLKRHVSLQAAAHAVRKILDSGEPLARFRMQQDEDLCMTNY